MSERRVVACRLQCVGQSARGIELRGEDGAGEAARRGGKDLDGDFRLKKFRHEARWQFDKNRIEMHLVSLDRQSVRVGGANCRASFEAGESIWTESSQKFTPELLEEMGSQAGFAPFGQWIDAEWPFSENLWLAQ